MQRIESGRLKGRRFLPLPNGVDGLRPMAARVRGAVFDRLAAHLHGARVLDLFSGSGALAFEALSRGAVHATLVESDPRVIRHLRAQAAALGVQHEVEILRGALPAALRRGPGHGSSYDLVLIDPPFAHPDVIEPVARALVEHGWLRRGAVVVCERERVRGKSAPVAWPAGLVLEDVRVYGQAQVDFLHTTGGDAEDPHTVIEPPVSRRAAAIRPSATLAVSARAGELKAEGKKILDFSAGEPDFKPPTAVREAVAAMVRNDACRYAPVPGTPALRDAVAAELGKVHDHRWSRAEIVVSCGAKHSLANLFLACCDAGDEVVIPAPYWVSYPDMVGLADATPVVAHSRREDGFRLRPEALEAVLTDRTRFFILNSPSNPTGAGYRAEDIRAIGEVLAKKAPQAWIVCDDIYRQLVYDGFEFASAVRTLADLTDRIIVVDGVSKTYAMTGYRIGYMAAPAEIISAVSRIQSQMTSGPATPSLLAAHVALTDPTVPVEVAQMHEAFIRRRRLILDGLAEVPGADALPPDGAFYVFVDVSRHTGEGTAHADDIALATWLLEQKLVATVPGSPFGAPGYLRMSYATDDDTIREGVSRIADAFASLPTGR